MLRKTILKTVAALTVLGVATVASGFGTISIGQNREHERITRHALSCTYNDAKAALNGLCFEGDTMDELAGSKGFFGAVGAPDRGPYIFISKAHCDKGDFLDTPGYPNTREKAHEALLACRALMESKLDEAVHDADGMVDSKGKVNWLVATSLHCNFVGAKKGRPKCNVLEDMGDLLHASEDFYSHSNWADKADSTKPVSTENPPGLGHHEPAPFISLRGQQPVPPGLISGCYGTPEALFCKGRVMHEDLNKDQGTIDPEISAPKTHRGKIADNFKWAVQDAILDTRDKWALLQERLLARYGEKRGKAMICALRKDSPRTGC